MKKKIVIVGSNGQLGSALAARYPEATALSRDDLDISNTAQVESFDWASFDIIMNAAAYVNADLSETDEKRSQTWLANANGPRNLTQAALLHDLTLVHFSSEYVFDGSVKNHDENESFTPLSVYGQSKAAGDLVTSIAPKHYILRTTWVVGNGHNFVRTMARLARLRIDPKVVNDQYGRLSFTDEIARAVDHLLEHACPYGTYNVTNSGDVKSWADIAADVFEYAGFDRHRVKYISTEEYSADKTPFAPRPIHSDLNLDKLTATGFISADYAPMMKDFVLSLGAVNDA